MSLLPVVMGPEGPIPTSPADLYNQLLAAVAILAPGYTARLPGSLVEDIGSTDTGALIICDQAITETINSLTPKGANAFLLNQLGQIYGVQLNQPTNTSVFVVFAGTVGFVIAKGFVVSDGTFQYTLLDGGIVESGGVSPPLFAIATQSGIWAVAPGTVTQLVTSVDSSITLSVVNPLAGTPGVAVEDETAYRARVLQAGLASSQGMLRYLRTAITNVIGVQARLVSVVQKSTSYEIIAGGSGDPYQIAYAIFSSDFWLPGLVGSTLGVTAITNANPGVVTTNLNHGYLTGQTGVVITGALGMTAVNGVPYTVTVIDEKRFNIGVDTTGFGSYTSGGVVTPNFRNIVVSINDFPDTYAIPFVTPPLQIVTIDVAWNTISMNFVSPVGVAQLAQPALAAYVNSIVVGAPINLFELESVFRDSISTILDPLLLTRMVFTVAINGVVTAPASGTGIIAGDPESYFSIVASAITIIQG